MNKIFKFMDISPDCYLVFQSNGRVVYVNNKAMRVFGRKIDLETKLTDFIEGIPAVLSSHQIMTIVRENCKLDYYAWTGFARDIKKAWEWRIYKIGASEYVMQGVDVSRAMCGHLIAYETQEQMSNIIAHIPGLVFWKDRSSNILGGNENFMKIAGEDKGSIIGKSDYELPWILTQTEGFRRDDRQVIETGMPKINIEETMRGTNGNLISLLTSKVPLHDIDGNTIGIIGICADITDRKQAEIKMRAAKQAAEVANRSKSDFLANISHDIRTPLNGVLGMAQLLKNSPHSPAQNEMIDGIMQASDDFLYLIENVLDFVRIESGKVTFVTKDFDLHKVVLATKKMFISHEGGGNLKLEVDIADNVSPLFIGDSQGISRILINLVSNAFKFTPSGTIRIKVWYESVSSYDAIVKISVSDTGMGMPADKLDYVFDRFNRLTPSYKGVFKGSGLGLAIVKELLRTMGGSIAVESEIGKGSTFTVTLPLQFQMQSHSSLWYELYGEKVVFAVKNCSDLAIEMAAQFGAGSCHVMSIDKVAEGISREAAQHTPVDILLIDAEENSEELVDFCKYLGENKKCFGIGLILCASMQKSFHTDLLGMVANGVGLYQNHLDGVGVIEQMLKISREWQELERDSVCRARSMKLEVLLVEDDRLSQRVAMMLLEDIGCKVTIAKSLAIARAKIASSFDLVFLDLGLPDGDGLSLLDDLDQMVERPQVVILTGHVVDHKEYLEMPIFDFLQKPLIVSELERVIFRVLDVASSRKGAEAANEGAVD